MDVEKKLSRAACEKLRAAISDAMGNEVVAAGFLGKDGIIEDIKIVSRGDVESAPALIKHFDGADVVIHNHPSGVLAPSKADLSFANYVGDDGIGFFIVDNSVRFVYVVTEPIIHKEISPISVDKLAAFLEPGGAFSGMETYEYREKQVDLLKKIAKSFNESEILIAEAGTGIGKSYAYIIPAIKWAEENQERVVISTATINLQQQLIEKDIPLVKKMLGSDIKVCLVKGRQNYLCRRRLAELLTDGDSELFTDMDKVKEIAEWADNTPTGDKVDIPFFVEPELWSRVCSETETCMGIRCPDRERCHVLRVRKEAASSGILVVNHHLLFSDLSIRLDGRGFEGSGVLPSFHRLIFDEAHNLENSATSFFSMSLLPESLWRLLRRFFSIKKGRKTGALMRLTKELGPSSEADELQASAASISAALDTVQVVWLAALSDSYTLSIKDSSGYDAQMASLAKLQEEVLHLVSIFDSYMRTLDDTLKELPVVQEALMLVNRIGDAARFCQAFRDRDMEDMVYWAEKISLSRGGHTVRLIISPINPGKYMKEALYETCDTIVFTSATLTVKNDFSFWKRSAGLIGIESLRHISEAVFPSPFCYEENVLLAVPSDLPMPDSPDYCDALSSFLRELLIVSEGHALILFTSYSLLSTVYEQVAPFLRKHEIVSFRQGEDERSRLLNRFKDMPASVLFGTESFWEGVDVPGDALKLVVLSRLPFRVPSHPITEARISYLNKHGKRAFALRQLPEAVMRFKQGFGRLMRRSSDRGVVLVTDVRCITKPYGRLFLDSVPPARQFVASSEAVISEVEGFLYG
ncbi:helicase C-terminal domain-containing protein [Spirochaetia bacterium 38H-sp]|uniref:Helicase C-terminal domain-containing protein n=1 Tax=Rarispira pelagica TaxID=3141764 RepID=A0ABU9UF83_9SPIR